MSDARKNRGQGNGGEAYRNSSFWDSLENKEEPKRPNAPSPMSLRFTDGVCSAESEMQKAEKALALFGKAFLVDGKYVEHHRVQVLIKGEDECDCNGCKLNGGYQPCLKSASKLSAPPSKV